MKTVPVVILNGFLGSGKTTLFRSLLSQSKQKNITVCAIVNDMSELDVDGELIGNMDIVEENKNILVSISGCVLSSKKGIEKLDEAVQKFLSQQDPELIIIETSGSCHPMPLIEYFKNEARVSLTGVFVFVDSLMLAHDFKYGKSLFKKMQENMIAGKRNTINLLVEQILFCSHLLITKADRIDAKKLPDIATYIQQINPTTSTHSVVFGKLAIESLFELQEYNYFKVEQLTKELKPILETEEHGDSPYNIETKVIKDDRPFHPKRLWNVCHQYLDKGIYRSKGFFWLASRDKQSLLWQQAAGGISLEIIGFWRSGIVEDENHGLSKMEIDSLKELLDKEPGRFGDRHCDLTIIGDKTQISRFRDKLMSCFLTEDEIKLWKSGHQFEDPWPKNVVKMKN
ncbi:MAG: GTP-binding protein [Bacteroidota bacterium]